MASITQNIASHDELNCAWPTLLPFSVDVRSQLDETTPVHQRRVTGLAFQGADPSRFWNGRGFGVLFGP